VTSSCLRRGDARSGPRRAELEVMASRAGCGGDGGGDGVVVVELALAVAGHQRKDPEVSIAHDGAALATG
jgi:hypothetical protein